MNIGIDIDDVLAEFQIPFLKFYNNKHATFFQKKDIHKYDYTKIFNISYEDLVKNIYEFYQTKEFEQLLPSKDSRRVIRSLKDEHKLYVITSRPFFLKKKTHLWIEKHYPRCFQKVLHTNQFSPKGELSISKTSMCKENHISILIDDAPDYVLDAAQNGLRVILLEKPWNKKLRQHPQISVAHCWNDIPNCVHDISKVSKEYTNISTK